MKCSSCSNTETAVVDSRSTSKILKTEHLKGRRRRRECYWCKTRFSTYELTEKDLQALLDKVNKAEHLRNGFESLWMNLKPTIN